MPARPDRTFQLLAGNPALDLVNTLDWRFRASGPEELLASYRDLLLFARQSNLLDAPQFRRLAAVSQPAAGRVLRKVRQLREELAAILYATLEGRRPPGAAITVLERFAKEALAQRSLRWKGSGMTWEWGDGENKAEYPLWLLAAAAVNLLSGGSDGRLRECGDGECRWLFLDTSRNRSRRWCDMKVCGNRMKARRFKAKAG